MRKVLMITILFVLSALQVMSQGYDKQCYYGISFEVSQNKSWGYGELVITDVEPNSPAEVAGIKVNDIIMEINGKATFLRNNVTIADWLFDNPDPVVKFTIRNVDTYFKEYTLNRECITVNSVDENYLATIFSFYSLEDTRQQKFTLPLQVTPNTEVDLTDYHTYAYYDDGEETPAIDNKLKEIADKYLQKMGLVKDTEDPHIWINLYYEYDTNPLFTGLDDPSVTATSERYNTENKTMEKLPVFDTKELNANIKAQYIAKIGLTFYDKKHISQTEYTQIWDCNIADYLSDNYSLERYAEFHIPLMLMQYPYSETKTESDYFVSFTKFNYTGIHFDADDLCTVNDIDQDSPAFVAGIRPGYKITKINNDKFDFTQDAISESYKNFISETMMYRDTSTRFVGVEGFEDCMFWNVAQYSDIAKQFKKSKYLTNFSYLYDFKKYVNPNYSGKMNVEAWDGIQRRIFTVRPVITESVVIKAL